MAARELFDAIILGGGPAGSAAGRLLSAWGHSVLLVDKPAPPSRGLAESLPPSTQKLLARIGVLADVERAGFFRATGNTSWWASGDRRVEPFGSAREALGYQVHRPAFDRLLLDCARDAGARVRTDARVRLVRLADDRAATVEYDAAGRRQVAAGRFVLDCTGRAGLVARRFRRAEPGYRTCALVGVWQKSGGWNLPDDTHTIVETFDDGWMWSVPVSSETRHVGAMVARTSLSVAGERVLESAYRAEIAKAANVGALLEGAALQRVWACDASLYSSDRYAGPQFLLIGDAGSFIDPLSSFGVKKALASAWLGAIAVHTCLADPGRQDVALAFFSAWERDVYAKHLDRSRAFARDAHVRHPNAFWASRAVPGEESRRAEALRHAGDGEALRHAEGDESLRRGHADAARDPDVLAAFERFKQARTIHLTLADDVRLEPRPVIRDREIVLEDAFVEPARPHAGEPPSPEGSGEPRRDPADGASARVRAGAPESLRFLGNVDLVMLARIACRHNDVPDVFDDYCRTCAPVPLPSVVGALSVLVARGILHERA